MDKKSLVLLKGSNRLVLGDSTFAPLVPYRCVEVETNGVLEYIVYGERFTERQFQLTFDYLYDIVMLHLNRYDLVKDYLKPISFTKFISLANIHEYGRRNSCHRIYFFGVRDFLIGFYTTKAPKKDNNKEAYKMYLDFINGDVTDFDNGFIQLGNCGIPIGYGDLRKI